MSENQVTWDMSRGKSRQNKFFIVIVLLEITFDALVYNTHFACIQYNSWEKCCYNTKQYILGGENRKKSKIKDHIVVSSLLFWMMVLRIVLCFLDYPLMVQPAGKTILWSVNF